MEAIIRTENKTLFVALLNFLKTLNISIEMRGKNKVSNEFHNKKKIDINSFSFFQSMDASKGIKGSLCDAVIQERKET